MTPRAPRPTADDQPTTSVDFINDGRTFSCSVAPRSASETALWWWFRVSSDGSRYAPFLASSDDTPASIQSRIVAYYDDLLARRAAPSVPRWQRARPAAAAPATE
jgi:hypothetical protein